MSSSKASELQEVADAIRSGDRFLLVTHENPDGDALGSILGMKLALDSLGKDVQMYLAGELDLPREYSFMELGDLRRTLPDDAAERILLALDCANASRTGLDAELIHCGGDRLVTAHELAAELLGEVPPPPEALRQLEVGVDDVVADLVARTKVSE